MRLAERKKWLKKNSAARNQIAKEQKKFESLHANTVQQSNVNNSPPTNGSQEPNYEAAEALFGIANNALNSTLPKKQATIKCNTQLNPMGEITNCR